MKRITTYVLFSALALTSALAQTKTGGISPEMLQEIQKNQKSCDIMHHVSRATQH